MATKSKTKTGLFTQVIENKGKVFFGKYLEQFEEGCVPVEKDGVTKHYESFEQLNGMLDEVYCYKKDIGNNKHFEMLVINLRAADGSIESVSVAFDSGFAQSFIQRLENIDRTKEVFLNVYSIKDAAKSAVKGVEVRNKFLIPLQPNENGELIKVENKYAAKFAESDTEKKKNLNPHQLPKFDEIKTKENGKPKISYNSDNFKEALREIVKNQNAAYKVANEAERAVETPVTDEINEDFSHD